ncbi:hypothetical protein FACS1894137_00200 [Spirochaetia bacterium]|nr:hypothetical protein FACS1894137_00200 [Spirochaetia bacterium]
MKKLLPTVLLVYATLNLFAQNAALPRLAVVKFTGDATERDAKRVRDMVESVMIDSGNYTVVSTDDIDQILEQQKIALSSIGSADNITKLKRENIQYIVTGTVNREAAESFVSLRMLDVTNAKFIPNSPRGVVNMTSMTTIYQGVGAIAAAFLAGGRQDGTVAQKGNVRDSYRIGDSGPAGGFVFYDKGNNSDGWRYLEAAPQDLGEAPWGWYENEKWGPAVSGTGTEIGRGKRNTQLIVDALKHGAYTVRAAQLCTSFNYGGYTDWFLPSKDELDLIYKNLAIKGVGGFTGDWYWSSSENNTNYAWSQNFSDGRQYAASNGKLNPLCVRAVRAF